jgi:Spy/CpxP family protein refolding chaperone
MKRQMLTKGTAGRWVPVALAAFLMLSMVATADAQRPGHGRGMRAQAPEATSEGVPAPAGHWDRFCERLELSDEQREAIEKLREEGRQQGIETQKELMRARNELRGVMLEDEPSLSTVRSLARKIGELETEREITRLEHRLAVREILTPEQRDRLLLMDQRRGHQRGGAGRGGHRGCDGHRMGRGQGPGPCGHGAHGAPMAPGCGHGGQGRGCGFHGEWFAPEAPDAPVDETVEYGLLWEEPPLDE